MLRIFGTTSSICRCTIDLSVLGNKLEIIALLIRVGAVCGFTHAFTEAMANRSIAIIRMLFGMQPDIQMLGSLQWACVVSRRRYGLEVKIALDIAFLRTLSPSRRRCDCSWKMVAISLLIRLLVRDLFLCTWQRLCLSIGTSPT